LKVANAECFKLRNKGGMKIWVKLEGLVKNSVSIDGKRDLRLKLERRLLVGKKISSGTKCEEYYGFSISRDRW